MGGHQSHPDDGEGQGSGDASSGASTPRAGSRRGMSRSGSGVDIQENSKPSPALMVPVDKLAKLLVQRSQKEDGVNGVTEKVFTKYLFPLYEELARRIYRHMHRAARSKDRHMTLAAFRAQCERVLALLDDVAVIETYVRMFSSVEEEGTVGAEDLRSLLYTCYQLSMDHYPDGPRTCLMINKTLSAVVNGCFNNKDSHSIGFVVRWLEQHCHRLIFPLHRYCVHILATRHRDIEAHTESGGGAGLELTTPVMERAVCTRDGLLPLSAAWLLAGTAPPLYSLPLGGGVTGGTLPSRQWLARLVCAVPSHWQPLYASREHGLGTNRFLHHTLAYRGPTLVLVQAEAAVLVVCSAGEWRDTHHYWGGEHSALIQLQPTFEVMERGPKMLYLNTTVRGYPRGLRAGSDPRAPLLSVDEGFERATVRKVPYALKAVEVWGCGDGSVRESQLDVKKWQVREAEAQRQIKVSAADWMEHPDRYLLELAGRPQYNNMAS